MHTSNRIYFYRILTVIIIVLPFMGITHNAAAAPTPKYANLSYDVVYVRCPRGREPVSAPGGRSLGNTNGANDRWLEVENNIYQEQGCDLVLHHSTSALPPGDPGREEVLDKCDGRNCTIVDPNVSQNGRYVVYTKWDDTSKFMKNLGYTRAGGYGSTLAVVSFIDFNPAGPIYAHGFNVGGLTPYDSAASLWIYDLQTKTTRRLTNPVPKSPVHTMDTGGFWIDDNTVGFTSNREHGFLQFQIWKINTDGTNLQLLGHRAMGNQLHPWMLKDGRIGYTSSDAMLQLGPNNKFSLFTFNPDGSNPFILAGKHDATMFSYHYSTQLSNGDIVTTLYYNHNNDGLGTLLEFPVDPPGPDFVHLQGKNQDPYDPTTWNFGNYLWPFARVEQFILTTTGSSGDVGQKSYPDPSQYWVHPNGTQVTMQGKFTHPSAAPNNDLLVTYAIGGGSTNTGFTDIAKMNQQIGKDGGIWLIHGGAPVGDISTAGQLVVDSPDYHEIMPRAVVTYQQIYGQAHPTKITPVVADGSDDRIKFGEAAGLRGAASLLDRETKGLNGVSWNCQDGGGYHSGRTCLNMLASGADLGFYKDADIYGIRVLEMIPPVPNDLYGGDEQFAGAQYHKMAILGEFPVRKSNGPPLDSQGNPDTSFLVKVPAFTPIAFQAINKYGMGLNIETAALDVGPGEIQLCGGCHVHTREAQNPFLSPAFTDHTLVKDATAPAQLLEGPANQVYAGLPGAALTRSFRVDWSDIAPILQKRCASCHGEGKPAQQLTGLRLDGDPRTYDLITRNSYKREDGVTINASTKPGDGLNDVINGTPGTDRITVSQPNDTRVSRWIKANSALSSMLVWALYGERMDGRDPATGKPPAGELVAPVGRDSGEVWPKVGEHLAYVASMPESEKRLITRWIDTGAALVNVHEDLAAPVITITPNLGIAIAITATVTCPPPATVTVPIPPTINIPSVLSQKSGASILPLASTPPDITLNSTTTVQPPCETSPPLLSANSLVIGLWDDSPIDWSKFTVTLDGIALPFIHNGDLAQVALPSFNPNSVIEVTAYDLPDTSLNIHKKQTQNVRHVSRTMGSLLSEMTSTQSP